MDDEELDRIYDEAIAAGQSPEVARILRDQAARPTEASARQPRARAASASKLRALCELRGVSPGLTEHFEASGLDVAHAEELLADAANDQGVMTKHGEINVRMRMLATTFWKKKPCNTKSS